MDPYQTSIVWDNVVEGGCRCTAEMDGNAGGDGEDYSRTRSDTSSDGESD